MADELENLTGVVEGITYRNEANGFKHRFKNDTFRVIADILCG